MLINQGQIVGYLINVNITHILNTLIPIYFCNIFSNSFPSYIFMHTFLPEDVKQPLKLPYAIEQQWRSIINVISIPRKLDLQNENMFEDEYWLYQKGKAKVQFAILGDYVCSKHEQVSTLTENVLVVCHRLLVVIPLHKCFGLAENQQYLGIFGRDLLVGTRGRWVLCQINRLNMLSIAD